MPDSPKLPSLRAIALRLTAGLSIYRGDYGAKV
jgi:hypothetical protein